MFRFYYIVATGGSGFEDMKLQDFPSWFERQKGYLIYRAVPLNMLQYQKDHRS